MDIFYQNNKNATPKVLISLLKLMLDCDSSHNVLSIWEDIQILIIDYSNVNNNEISLLCSLWLKCCIQSNKIDINKCIEMLQWTQNYCNQLSIHGYLTNKLISKCGTSKDSRNTLKYLHQLINANFFMGHKDNIIIQNALINAYGECKDTKTAMDVFDCIKNKDEISLGAIMKTLINNGQSDQSLKLYQQYDELHNEITNMLAIKACTATNNLEFGKSIDSKINNQHFENISVCNALIEFYGHFGNVNTAKSVYDSVPCDKKQASIMCAMIKAYIDNNQYQNGLNLYDDIISQHKFNQINDYIHILAIQTCGILKDLKKGTQIHKHLRLSNKKVKLKDALIDFYFKCGDLYNAELIFKEMRKKPTRTINAMIKGYVQMNMNEKALKLYDTMDFKDKDEVSYLFAIKACINTGDIIKGKQIHESIDKDSSDLSRNGIAIQNALIELYAKFHDIPTAIKIFESLLDFKKIYSIGPMMGMYINHNEEDKALELYKEYKCDTENVPHVLAIKACTKLLDLERGKYIHSNISKTNYCLELQNALINFYGDCGDISEAINVFDSISHYEKDIVTVSSIMKAYINNNLQYDALNLYDIMGNEYEHVNKDDIIHTLAIKACADIGDLQKGKQIHSLLIPILNDEKLQLKNGLIKLYGNCMDIDNAENIFNSIGKDNKDIITINSMMQAYIDNDQSIKALQIYDTMRINKDDVCHMLVINACINLEDYQKGIDIISNNIRLTRMSNIKLKTTLIDFYGHCGKIDNCEEIFDSIPNQQKNIVTITAMMEAYWNCDMHSESIELFENIQNLGTDLEPEIGCFVSALKACTNGAVLHLGQKIHNMLKNTEMMNDIGIEINLIKMYGKCGELNECKQIFNNAINKKSIGIWNAMIHAYGRNGETNEAIKLYQRLLAENKIEPDIKTYMHLIGACSHSGDIELAKQIWVNIKDDNYKYHTKVISIFIDCLARKGELKEAEELILSIDDTEISAWISLISGCKKYKDQDMAEQVYSKINDRFGSDAKAMSAASMIMSNIYGYNNEYETSDQN